MKKTALFTSLLCLAQSSLHADVPLFINYQGKVADSTGLPIGATGTAAAPVAAPVNRKVIFRIYDASTGGNRLWTEEQTATISLGVFSVLLGNGIAPTGTASTESRPAFDTIFTPSNASSRFLEIMVDNGDNTITGSDVPISPRQQITSTAFALHAKVADGIASATDLTITPLSGTATNYGLGWYGTGRTFNSVAIDGPVLYGNSGGALGSNASGTQKLALAWNAAGQVGVGASSSYDTNNKLTLQGDDNVTPARQLVIRGNTDSAKRLNIGFNTTANQATLQSYTAAATAGNLLLNPSGGNIGIGSATAPTAKLSIGDPLGGDASTLGTSFTTNAGALGTVAGSELILGNFGFNANSNSSLAISAHRTTAGTNWFDTALVLGMNVDLTRRAGGGFISMHGNGNIGISTLNPGFKLDVNGTARVVGKLNTGGLSVGGSQVAAASSSTAVANIGGGDVNTYFGSYDGASSYATWLQALRPSDQLTFPMAINPNGGNVGIGTAAPAFKLDVNGTARVTGQLNANGQLNVGGAIVMAKDQSIYGTSVAGEVQNAFWPRASNGTYLNYGTSGLFIRNNASAVEMYLNGGRLGVGTTDTSQGAITTTTTGFTSLGTANNGNTSYAKMSYRADRGGIAFDVYNTGQHPNAWRGFSYDGDSNIDWYSDRKLKKDIVDAEPMLDRLMQVPFRRFRWKDISDPAAKPEFGVIAQEVEPLFPDLVATGKDGLKTVGYTSFATITAKALQEYKTRNDADLSKLNAQIQEKDARIAALEAKLAAQEQHAAAQADADASQNARLVAIEKLLKQTSAPETVSIKLGE
jgi:hypothetical protein